MIFLKISYEVFIFYLANLSQKWLLLDSDIPIPFKLANKLIQEMVFSCLDK